MFKKIAFISGALLLHGVAQAQSTSGSSFPRTNSNFDSIDFADTRSLGRCDSVQRVQLKSATKALRGRDFETASEQLALLRSTASCQGDLVVYLSGIAEFHSGNLEKAETFLKATTENRSLSVDFRQRDHARKLLHAIRTGNVD